MKKQSHRPTKSAHLQSGHAEYKQNSEKNELIRTEDLMSVDIPEETAFLMAMDNLQNAEVKETVLSCFKDTHEHRKSIMTKAHDRMEQRADKANDAYIKRKDREQTHQLIIFIILIGAFVYCQQHGASAYQLLCFAIFFLGPAGYKYIKSLLAKNNSRKE